MRARHTSPGARVALRHGAARPIWKGSISFGLVTIPVDLFPADASKDLALHLLDKRDFAPVGYERINKVTGENVPWADVVKGYEHQRGEYVVLTDEELASANTEKTQTIDLQSFVDADEVDPMLFNRPYWWPSSKSKGSIKAYALLREALAKTGKVGIGNVVLRTRAHLAALVPKERALALVMLRYADELRPEADLELPPGDGQEGRDQRARARPRREARRRARRGNGTEDTATTTAKMSSPSSKRR